ncbi:MAG: hypothetical protein FWE06_03085 [Oscillospiraceae bacterium]|nr:hypothetical protein [Oscillospiraceae bacterium]
MEEIVDNRYGLVNEITEAITNHPIIMILIALAIVILLLFISRSVFKNTKYARFVQQKILGNPFISLFAILLTIGLATIWIWWEFEDEISLTAWSVIMSSAVVIMTITYSVIQSKNTFRQQAAFAQLGLMPCLYVTTSKNTAILTLPSGLKENQPFRQTFKIECISEYPAFDVNWFLWTSPTKPYLFREYEKSKVKIPTPTYTLVKGKSYQISLNIENVHMEQVLVAEYKDISRSEYTQIFALKLNKASNEFDVDGVDSPTPIPVNERNVKKR